MRKAIIDELKEITEFGNRVYQPYIAPANTTTPSCVVKMGEESPTGNKKGSLKSFEVYIYNSPSSFISLDSLEIKVKVKLDQVTILTDESPARQFYPEYERTLPDFKDDEKNLLMKTLQFKYAMARH